MCNIAVISVLLIVNLSQDAEGLAISLTEIDYFWILIAFLVGLLSMFIDVGKYTSLIYTNTKQLRPYLAYKVTALGKYYDNITPMGFGGQPFQIHYLSKRGINGEVATNIPLTRLVFWQLAFVLINIIIIFSKITELFGSNPSFNVIFSMAIIALVANSLLFVIILFFSISKRIAPRIIIWGLKILAKLKIVKNYQLQFRKTMAFVRDYQKCFKDIEFPLSSKAK